MTTDVVTRLPARNIREGSEPPRELSTTGLVVALLGMFMAVADFFIVNVALPSIERTLHADAAGLELVIAGYGTAYAVFLVIGGRLGDSRGRRTLFLAGVTAFTVASAICGISPNIVVLIGARVVQGAAAAAFVPQVLATIHASLSGGARSRALGWYGATLGVAAVVGQLLGGVIVQLDIAGLSWRPVFLVNVPVGLATLFLAGRLLPETRSDRGGAPDVRGAALLGIALLGLLIPATMGRELGWPIWTLACLPAAPIALAALIRHGHAVERAGGEPLLPTSLLALRGIRAGIGVSIALFIAAGGFFLTTALSLQQGLGFGPLASGLTMVPFALAFLIASLGGRRIIDALGSRIVVVGGLAYAAGMSLLALQAWVGFGAESILILAPAMVIIGTGQGLVVAPLFGIALQDVPGNRAGTASGLLTTIIQASLAVGAATIGLVFFAIIGPGSGRAAFGHGAVAVAVVQAVLGACVALLATQLPAVRAQDADADRGSAETGEIAA